MFPHTFETGFTHGGSGVVGAMLHRMRLGCPWRDLPAAFGSWRKVYKRFNARPAAKRRDTPKAGAGC